MKKTFGKSLKVLAMTAIVLLSGSTFTSCDDQIAEENRFTFKGQLIADFLLDDPDDRFSKFCYILEKAKIGRVNSGNMLLTLSTYGSYTCFAPTNEAIDSFLRTEYRLYQESLAANSEDPKIPIYKTGIKSPYLEELSDSMATEIAKNHLIEQRYELKEAETEEGGKFPLNTMNARETRLKFEIDPVTNFNIPVLNEKVHITSSDNEVENGFIHVIDYVLSPSQLSASELVAEYSAFSLFSEALVATGFDKVLNTFDIDPGYKDYIAGLDVPQFGTQSESEVPCPEERKHKFTLFIETDELLADPTKNHLGWSITTLDQLEEYAAEWYGGKDLMGPEHRQNPENPLYKFVAYHILDRKLSYTTGFVMDNFTWDEYNFKSNFNLGNGGFDMYDYYETYLPATLMKITKPITNKTKYTNYSGESVNMSIQKVINYSQNNGTAYKSEIMRDYHNNIVIENPALTVKRPGLQEFDPEPMNGSVYTIDKILIYNEQEMEDNILNERMRWDVMSFFPELTNNGIRWKQKEGKTTMNYIPEGYSTRIRHRNADTHLYYLRPHRTGTGGYVNYMGDELLATGSYDFEYRIPFVPTGDYEIRFGFSISDARGVVQIYFNNDICGIPTDLRRNNDNLEFLGWVSDEDKSPTEIEENDKAMRNRGFMKAPASCFVESTEGVAKSMRDSDLAYRKIVGTYHIINNPDYEYWMRFKEVSDPKDADNPYLEFNQDYLEIVPVNIINNPAKPEDKY